MSESVVAKRYADALFQLADEKDHAETLMEELAVVRQVFEDNPTFIQLMNHPQISLHDKMNMIDEAFATCDQDIVHTLKVLITRHRISSVIEVIDEVKERYNEANGIAVATVHAVRELSDNEKEHMADSLQKQWQKKDIIINNVVDPSVIGGLKIRVGNTIYDGTISGKLNQMKHNIGVPSI